MEKLRENRFTFLNATHIKLFALLFMTIDHIGYFGFYTPPISDYYSTLRLIGRIAAPLFLYFVVEGVKHTRNKEKFLIRLYIAAVCTELCNKLVSKFLFNSVLSFGNIFYTFAWVVLLIIICDKVIEYIKTKNFIRASLYSLGILAFIVIVHFIEDAAQGKSLISNIIQILFRSPGKAEYSLICIIIGIAWYYTDSRIIHCLILLLPCITSFLGILDGVTYCNFARGNQWGMIFALPFILLYNGKRGKGMKYLFYIYYPLHTYLLAMLIWGIN